jgi:hypothetical protein
MAKILGKALLVAQSVADTAVAVDLSRLGLIEATHYISWSAGVVSGVVQIETADSSIYTGTWAPIATITFSGAAPKQDYAAVTGSYAAIRHRISTAVVGGTVSTRIDGSL